MLDSKLVVLARREVEGRQRLGSELDEEFAEEEVAGKDPPKTPKTPKTETPETGKEGGGGGDVGGGGGGGGGGGRASLPEIDAESRGQAPLVAGGNAWIRKANEEADRAARRQISAATSQAAEAKGYKLGSSIVRLHHVDELVAGTKLLSPSLKGAHWPSLGPLGKEKTVLCVERGTVLDVAVQEAKAGEAVVAVNAASAYHAGGGFSSGGRHALEEAMCVQSSLYKSLEHGIGLAESAGVQAPTWVQPAKRRDGSPWVSHLPDDGVLLSPKVEVFRGGTNEGYPFLDEAVKLEAVVSVAMPNRNAKMSDSPVDAHPEDEAYKTQLLQKWRAVLTAASCCLEATSLVVPDAGCGVFYNPPEEVGTSLGEVLKEFNGRFKRVLVAFPGGKAGEAFAEAAAAAFAREKAAQDAS